MKLFKTIIPFILHVAAAASAIAATDYMYTGAPRVLVVGFGPSGMFFCHALETRRRELEDKGDSEGLAMLPKVTAFERSSTYGGVWKQRDTSSSTDNDTTMHEYTWANGAKETAEFFDHTFDEHFGCALPTYVKRGDMLEYMTARVTKHCPDFFEKYVTYNTEVTSVFYNNRTSTFRAVTTNLLTGENSAALFDKVIWAAGVNAIPRVPKELARIFYDMNNPFKGTVIHSSNVNNLKENVAGKRVLLIGGASSAEDLALTSIRLGVDAVYISHRNEDDQVAYPETWPLGKVELFTETTVRSLDRDNCVWLEDNVNPVALVSTHYKLCGIDTVIFCTGYDADFGMLHPTVNGLPDEEPSQREATIYSGPRLQMPTGWKMGRNWLSEYLQEEVKPAAELKYWDSNPNLYRHSVSLDNPSLMYMVPNAISLNQLLWADVLAWQLLAFITGSAPLPKKDDMVKWQQDKLRHEMDIPAQRCLVDSNYERKSYEYYLEASEEDIMMGEIEEIIYHFKSLADAMKVGNYPVNIGSFYRLNIKGMAYVAFDIYDRQYWLPSPNSSKTFRDLEEENLEHIRSIYTGTKAVPFNKPWMDIDDQEDARSHCSFVVKT